MYTGLTYISIVNVCHDRCNEYNTTQFVFILIKPLDDVTRALVLSLGVCYHARLQEREPYRRAVARSFANPCQLPGGHERILQEIVR